MDLIRHRSVVSYQLTVIYWRLCFCLKVTVPDWRANIVWSRPKPTPVPGRILVPRWRMRIMPVVTWAPPKCFKPKRFPGRGLCCLVLPPCFVFDMFISFYFFTIHDTIYFHACQALTMTPNAPVAGFGRIGGHADFGAFGLTEDGSGNLGA